MLRAIVGAAVLAAMIGSGGCQSSTGKTMGQTVDDSTITASVQGKLTSDRLSNFTRVDVDTDRGTVNLNGVVPTAEHKRRAEELARQVDGVKRVHNNLQIQTTKSE